MDDVDRRLMLIIYEDPRKPLKDIASDLGISRQAVHHRMRILSEMGVFRSMRATISVKYLDQVAVAIWDKSGANSVERTLDRLGESELTAYARVSGGNEFFVVGRLHDISELDHYVDFVKRNAEMRDPTVGIMSFGDGVNAVSSGTGSRKRVQRELTQLDLRIIGALQDDVRKPIAGIAKDVGVSPKTVRMHLDKMRTDGSLDFDQPWDLPPGEDLFTMMYIFLRSGSDKVRVSRRLLAKDPVHILLLRSFSNLPNYLLGLVCSDKMRVIRNILKEVANDEDVLSVIPNLVYIERVYPSWDWRVLERRNQSSHGAAAHRS